MRIAYQCKGIGSPEECLEGFPRDVVPKDGLCPALTSSQDITVGEPWVYLLLVLPRHVEG